ncbi:MAG: copper chaperone PCu(A)C [Anaerolineales bacterium]
MKKFFMFFVVGMLLLSACSAEAMEEGTDIEAHDPWARPALKGGTSAVYLLMHNHSQTDDEITGASTDVAEMAELHKSEMDANGVMQMTPQKSIPLPVDAEITFEPGGLHIMLVNLKKDLNVGDSITVVLHFKSHADISLTVPVLDAANPSMDMHMDATPTP